MHAQHNIVTTHVGYRDHNHNTIEPIVHVQLWNQDQ